MRRTDGSIHCKRLRTPVRIGIQHRHKPDHRAVAAWRGPVAEALDDAIPEESSIVARVQGHQCAVAGVARVCVAVLVDVQSSVSAGWPRQTGRAVDAGYVLEALAIQ